MSSNNQIIIEKTKKGYKVWEWLCVDNPFKKSRKLIGQNMTLEQAVETAKSWKRTCFYPVEYGIDFIGV